MHSLIARHLKLPKRLRNSLIASKRKQSPVLLATAWVTVRSPLGRTIVIRALLDQGFERTFISENLVQILRVKLIHMRISAVGEIHAGIFQHATHIFISPRDSHAPTVSTTALIMKSLTSYTPRQNRRTIHRSIKNSILGWIISGPITSLMIDDSSPTILSGNCTRVSTHHIVGFPSLEEELRRFWEVDGLPRQTHLTPHEK
ncbi:hypothetical protein ACFW04_014697 [Cataglyphis niger]